MSPDPQAVTQSGATKASLWSDDARARAIAAGTDPALIAAWEALGVDPTMWGTYLTRLGITKDVAILTPIIERYGIDQTLKRLDAMPRAGWLVHLFSLYVAQGLPADDLNALEIYATLGVGEPGLGHTDAARASIVCPLPDAARLVEVGATYRSYLAWRYTAEELGVLNEATGVDDYLDLYDRHPHAPRIWATAAPFGVDEATAVAMADGLGDRMYLDHIANYLARGRTPTDVVALLNAGVPPWHTDGMDLGGFTSLDDQLALCQASIPPDGIAYLRAMGVHDVTDVLWLYRRGLALHNLEAWFERSITHPLAILELQRRRVRPRTLPSVIPGPPTTRAKDWAALRETTCRVRSNASLITLTVSTLGITDPDTGQRPRQLAADEAFDALGGEPSRLLVVSRAWDTAMANPFGSLKVLPPALRTLVDTASNLWLADRYYEAVTRWGGRWNPADRQRVELAPS